MDGRPKAGGLGAGRLAADPEVDLPAVDLPTDGRPRAVGVHRVAVAHRLAVPMIVGQTKAALALVALTAADQANAMLVEGYLPGLAAPLAGADRASLRSLGQVAESSIRRPIDRVAPWPRSAGAFRHAAR